MLERLMPIAFVGIWSTGFIVARLIAPYAEPLTFLTWRYVLSGLAFALIARAVGAPWPRTGRAWANALVAGILLQGIYLGGVFWAVRHGMPAGIAALVVGLQPLATAILAYPLLGERVTLGQWLGTALGLAGAVLVLLPGITAGLHAGVALWPLAVVIAAMAGITLGTLWQKHTAAAADIRTNAAIQFIGAALVTAPIAGLLETGHIALVWQTVIGLAWSVLGLSVGAISLLLIMIHRGAVTRVANLFYLVPPVVAVLAWLLFDEALSTVQIIGMAIAAAGVALASRTGR